MLRHRFLTAACLTLFLPATAPAQLGSTFTQLFTLGMPGTTAPLQAQAELGAVLAVGDFNCDGFDDLAQGLPRYESLEKVTESGALFVLYGGAERLWVDGSQFLNQLDPDLPDVPELGDRFGAALAAGDFDGNACDDLAVGVPSEDLGTTEDVGAVVVLFGDPAGLQPGYVVQQGTDRGGVIGGAPEAGDRFGSALITHDFDLDGFDDLAIGVPGEAVGAIAGAGAVNVLFGSASSLTGARDRLFFRGAGGSLPGGAEASEALGSALAAGNLDASTGHELAIGCPSRSHDLGPENAGTVLVVRDLATDPVANDFLLDGDGALPAAESGDRFGRALAAGDYDGDGWDELAIGVPGRDVGAEASAGALAILDLEGTNTTAFFTQTSFNPENAEAGDQFGGTLATGDFDGDGVDDLAIGVPFEDLGPLANAGLVHVVHGTAGVGLTNAGDQIWLQTLSPADSEERFGLALAAGRFTGHAGTDLALGAPGQQVGAFVEAGAVTLLYSGALFADGFESGDLSAWTSVTP
jgi:hypothetical protein